MPINSDSQNRRPGGAITENKIPRHISEAAQDYYRNAERNTLDVDISDPAGAAALRKALHPLWAKTRDEIDHPYTLEADQIGGVAGSWITTPDTSAEQVILLCFHGGAYVLGSPEANAASAICVAHAAKMPVFSADYRLAPECPYPAAVDDAVAVFRALQAKGHSADRIGVIGESAGGGLALAMTLVLRDAGESLPGAMFLTSPWVDLEGNGDSVTTMVSADPDFADPSILYECVEPYAGSHSLLDPLISPVNGDLDGFPPLLIQVGSREILLSDSLRLARNARNANVDVTLDVWDGMWHVFNAYPNVPEAQRANAEAGAFFRRYLLTDENA